MTVHLSIHLSFNSISTCLSTHLPAKTHRFCNRSPTDTFVQPSKESYILLSLQSPGFIENLTDMHPTRHSLAVRDPILITGVVSFIRQFAHFQNFTRCSYSMICFGIALPYTLKCGKQSLSLGFSYILFCLLFLSKFIFSAVTAVMS